MNAIFPPNVLPKMSPNLSSTQSMPSAAVRPQPAARSAYKRFVPISTRWSDNDVYGHVNNVVYYSWFDTAVNSLLIEAGVIHIERGGVIGLVVKTQCDYFASLAFPQTVSAGVRVAHVGASSVRYEVGIFANGQDMSAASGSFVHVYVDRVTRRPMPLPAPLREFVESLRF
jgi:acyl-CoA thioester hydrolase